MLGQCVWFGPVCDVCGRVSVGCAGELVSGRGERGSGECTLPPGFPCTAKMCVGGPFIRCLGRRWGGRHL